MLTETQVKERIGGSPSGISAVFIPIDEEKGLKLWRYENTRDNVYEQQRVLAQYRLAPEVYEKVDVAGYYGYVTERIEPIAECDDYYEHRKVESKYADEIYFYEKAAKKHGFYNCDNHGGNYGIAKDGTFMCLDFGND